MFCDRFDVWQDHGHDNFDDVVSQYTFRTDPDGEVIHTGAQKCRIEGSHSTSIGVRAYGSVVSFDGNIGRFGRADNLDNFTVDETKYLINVLVESLGLPPFTGSSVNSTAPVISDHASDFGRNKESVYLGAKVVRIDLTENFATGSRGDSLDYIRHLSTNNYGRQKTGIGGTGESIVIGEGSRFVYQKAYLKADELLAHKHKTGVPAELISYCYRNGIVRYELELKQACDRYGVRPWNNCTQSRCAEIFEKYRDKVMVESDVKREVELPKPQLKTLAMFKSGMNPRDHMSRATWFHHRKIIKDQTGIDISNVRSLNQEQVKVIRLRSVNVPPAFRPSVEVVADRLRQAALEAKAA